MAAVVPHVIQLEVGSSAGVSETATREVPTPGIVAQVSANILAEVERGDLPKGEVGVVVAIIRDVLEAVRARGSKHGSSPAALEGLIKRVVARVFAEGHPVRKRIDAILWALKTAAATDKQTFGGAGMALATHVSVEAVMAAMQRVQATANAAAKKLSAATLQSEFGKEMAALKLHTEVAREAQQLVEAGLVTEVVSMLKDDGELSSRMTEQLKSAGLRLTLRAGAAVATRCASGQCRWKVLFCCSNSSSAPVTSSA